MTVPDLYDSSLVADAPKAKPEMLCPKDLTTRHVLIHDKGKREPVRTVEHRACSSGGTHVNDRYCFNVPNAPTVLAVYEP